VRAQNESLVATAGHCVHDEGQWAARKWVFIPGYRYGERPFGTFTAHWLGTTPGWLHHENFNFDVGMAVVGRNERGETLEQAVGGARFSSGLPPSQVFDVYGYPVAEPFTGATLERCPRVPFEGYDFEAFLTPGPLDLAVHCEVSGGSSGGGWVIAGNRIDGVTSNTYFDDDTTTYGPYFGGAVADLYARASRVR
jgi:V8-like Glu-specific endopeptidase